MACGKSSSMGKAHINTCLPQETKKKISNHLTLHHKELGKEQMYPKVCREKELTNISAKINETDTKKRPKKLRVGFFEKINQQTFS